MAKVHELFEVIKLDELTTQTVNQVVSQMNATMMQRMAGINISDSERKKIDDFYAQIKQIMTGALAWKSLEPEYAKLYADAYTEQQLDDLLAFYKSPTGQVVVEKTPVLLQGTAAIRQQRIVAVAPDLQKVFKDFGAALPSASHPATKQ